MSTQAERDERAMHRREEDIVHIRDEDSWADGTCLRLIRDNPASGTGFDYGELQPRHPDWDYVLYFVNRQGRLSGTTAGYDTPEQIVADGWRVHR